MAAIVTSRPHPGGLRNAFAQMIENVRAWNDIRRTRAALSQLTDRELEDIGLSRGDLRHVSRII
ncbi:MAG TPA: DUF1127 domain-containing protein [Roseovarius sp.]|nr:DUF1127 domain-containing protein [Roseovarius sp.]